MSGPDPNRPKPGSNSIGQFVIGVSPIGTIPEFDYWSTIISQYANSPVLTAIIGNFFAYADQTKNMDAFFDQIFNVATAQGYGLDVWGAIVNVSRTMRIVFDERYLGFEEATTISAEPFGQAPFYAGDPLTQNFVLADTPYRTLIYAKALANICNGSIPAINAILKTLFAGRGNCFVVDNLDMTIQYVFKFSLTAVELSILENSGVLPTPTGVDYEIVVDI